MKRTITLLGAPSNLGLKPYDDGRPRSVDRAPRVYRELGLAERLGARDLGDVEAPFRSIEASSRDISPSSWSTGLSSRLIAAISWDIGSSSWDIT